MSNTQRCTGRNGTYVCSLITGHAGTHIAQYSEAGQERRARWTTAYGEVRFTKPANGAARFPRPSTRKAAAR